MPELDSDGALSLDSGWSSTTPKHGAQRFGLRDGLFPVADIGSPQQIQIRERTMNTSKTKPNCATGRWIIAESLPPSRGTELHRSA